MPNDSRALGLPKTTATNPGGPTRSKETRLKIALTVEFSSTGLLSLASIVKAIAFWLNQ
jgi:hypothetical protein